MHHDGLNGDAVSGDGIYSVRVTIPAAGACEWKAALVSGDGVYSYRGPISTPGQWQWKVAVKGTPSCFTVTQINAVDVELGIPELITGISSVQPNPFRHSVEIYFALARPATTRLEIFDAAGRRVRLIGQEDLAPGRYSRLWDGRAASGHAARAGSYFVRLTVGGVRFTQRVVMIH